MTPFWIRTQPVGLAIIPRPRGGEWLAGDIKSLKREGIEVVVSALTDEEAEELELSQEGECCRNNEVEFMSFPIEDRSVPRSVTEFDAFLDQVQEHMGHGLSVGIHCRMSIGRSSLIAAGLLLRNGFSAMAAFQVLEEARGTSVPDTTEQRAWIERLAVRSEKTGEG